MLGEFRMADVAPRSMEERDPDLERWARELGVTYEELRSTLNYAGPTFRDLALSSDALRAASASMPS